MSTLTEKLQNLSWLWSGAKRKEMRRSARRVEPHIHFSGRYINKEQHGNDVILRHLKKNTPCLISRFGASEFKALLYFYQNKHNPALNFPEPIKTELKNASGFFSPSDELLTKFCCDELQILTNIDIFAPWIYKVTTMEKEVFEKYNSNAELVYLYSLAENLLTVEQPWTQYLKGKKVLVIHPFEASIRAQYKKRELLFKNPLCLPEFELITIKAIQGLGESDETQQYRDWFIALEHMYRQIDKIDFDIALIGAGAYGMFLGNYVKEIGKQAVHTAGATQLLFGIKGTRWNYLEQHMNEHWSFPLEEDTPKILNDYIKIEGKKAYW